MAYQKITDLFMTTVTDYNPKTEEAYKFFKIVQIKNMCLQWMSFIKGI